MNFRNVCADTLDVGKTIGKGLLSGTESALNGATLGGYRWLGDKVGLGVSQRAEELQQLAESAGVGGLNQIANFAAEMGGSLRGLGNLGYNAIKKGISTLAPQMSKSVVVPTILSGTTESAINSTFENDFSNWQEVGKDTVQGLGISGILSGFGTIANKGLRSLRNRTTLPYANIETMNFAPTREQIKAIIPESNFNPNKNLTRIEADALLRKRADIQNLKIYNDGLSYIPEAVEKRLGVQHFIGDNRRGFIRTLNNTLNNLDISFSADGRNFNGKIYQNSESGKNFMDFIITEKGNVVTKYPISTKKIMGQIKKSAQNMSLSERALSGLAGATYTPIPNKTKDNLPLIPVVVNHELSHVSSLSEGLSAFQKQQFGDSFRDVITNNSQKLGTLGSMYQLRDNLINKPYLSSVTDKLSEAILSAEQRANMPKWTRLLQLVPNEFNNQYPYLANTLSWIGSREY